MRQLPESFQTNPGDFASVANVVVNSSVRRASENTQLATVETASPDCNPIGRETGGGAGACSGLLGVSSLNCAADGLGSVAPFSAVEYLTPVLSPWCAWRYFNLGRWCQYPRQLGRVFCERHA